jgi:hypothetical protein
MVREPSPSERTGREGFLRSQATVCVVAAKQRASVRRSEGGTAQCGVSEVLSSSGVRAMSPKNWMYNKLIC